jgi:peptide-methionine (R)-S-oxide reductase
MKRRRFLILTAAAGTTAMPLLLPQGRVLAAAGGQSLEAIENNWRSLLPKGADVALSTESISKPEAEWQAQLGPKAYDVLFEEGTEPPFSSPLNDEKRAGVFVCAACSLPLFTSEMKYDSGTGWPSFFTHIAEHLDTKTDFKLIWPRTEYHCVKCGGHQGHVFKDGPEPTGRRWCNNGVALRFIPS